MIVNREDKDRLPIVIDLSGPDGNAYVLIGIVKKLCRVLEKDFDEIVSRMKESDYENLLRVVEEEFGEYVVMYR